MSDSNVVSNPYDINGQNFSPDMYLQRLFKECTLKEILDCESEIVRDTQSLHSDMQTLVYENYNKFISATDTVKKMKCDFKMMEDEMDQLAKNMESITNFSQKISSTLQDTRQQFTKLSSVHSLLKKLQFLFKLPSKMTALIEEENYAMAVQDYLHAQRVLERYGNMASFQGIKADCESIVNELKMKLCEQFKSKDTPAQLLAESVDLLLQLKEPPEVLCAEFLSYADGRLNEQLSRLEDSKDQDMIEFVHIGSEGFLSDLCLVVASYNDMFVNRLQGELDDALGEGENAVQRLRNRLNDFVVEQMQRYFSLVSNHVERQQESDTAVLVRALDRFHRRLQAVNTLFHHSDFARTGMEIVLQAGQRQCKSHLESLKKHLNDALTRVRQALATPLTPGKDENGPDLAELVALLVVAASEKPSAVLQDLQVFLQPDLTFAVKQEFRQAFCIDSVREGLIVAFIHHVNTTTRAFCLPTRQNTPPALLLILSKLCLEFESRIVEYLVSQTDYRFDVNVGANRNAPAAVTSTAELNAEMRAAAQELINHYVRVEGLSVSQMLRKSVEIRDWMHTIEPRTVRSVMKRVVEDVAAMDCQVGSLFEEGQRAERSSDSSRRTHSMSVSRQFRSAWSSYAPSQLDQSALASNLHKLFSERIEIFSSVNFSKVSILTGIIKIGLKTLLECVRLRTFNRFGLQQIQVDTHYLQLYLWRFVNDENLVLFLLGEVLSSTVHRCLDPVLMEPSVMDIICERG